MPFNEALFWFGITAFGTGLWFLFEGNIRLLYSIPLTVMGLLASGYSVYRHHHPTAPPIRLWVILAVLTWVLLGYDIYLHLSTKGVGQVHAPAVATSAAPPVAKTTGQTQPAIESPTGIDKDSTIHSASRTSPTRSVWELCRTLTKCPTPELQKRALVVASKVEGLSQGFVKKAREINRDEKDADVKDSRLKALSWRTTDEYKRRYMGAALAYRKELIVRIGDDSLNDSEKDLLYQTAHIGGFEMVGGDLRELANDPRLKTPAEKGRE